MASQPRSTIKSLPFQNSRKGGETENPGPLQRGGRRPVPVRTFIAVFATGIAAGNRCGGPELARLPFRNRLLPEPFRARLPTLQGPAAGIRRLPAVHPAGDSFLRSGPDALRLPGCRWKVPAGWSRCESERTSGTCPAPGSRRARCGEGASQGKCTIPGCPGSGSPDYLLPTLARQVIPLQDTGSGLFCARPQSSIERWSPDTHESGTSDSFPFRCGIAPGCEESRI